MAATFCIIAASGTPSVDHLSPRLENETVLASNQELEIPAWRSLKPAGKREKWQRRLTKDHIWTLTFKESHRAIFNLRDNAERKKRLTGSRNGSS